VTFDVFGAFVVLVCQSPHFLQEIEALLQEQEARQAKGCGTAATPTQRPSTVQQQGEKQQQQQQPPQQQQPQQQQQQPPNFAAAAGYDSADSSGVDVPATGISSDSDDAPEERQQRRRQQQQLRRQWGKGGQLSLAEAERDREERYFDD
jgi:hypothetical protein